MPPDPTIPTYLAPDVSGHVSKENADAVNKHLDGVIQAIDLLDANTISDLSNLANIVSNANLSIIVSELANTEMNVSQLTLDLGNTDINVAALVSDLSNTDGNVSALRVTPLVSDSILQNNFTVTSAYADQAGGAMVPVTNADASNVEVSFTAKAGETVRAEFIGSIELGATAEIILGFQLDNATPIVLGFFTASTSVLDVIVSLNEWFPSLPVGGHTICLVAAAAAGSPIIDKGGNSSRGMLRVIQF